MDDLGGWADAEVEAANAFRRDEVEDGPLSLGIDIDP